jgi:hypothetical protein
MLRKNHENLVDKSEHIVLSPRPGIGPASNSGATVTAVIVVSKMTVNQLFQKTQDTRCMIPNSHHWPISPCSRVIILHIECLEEEI